MSVERIAEARRLRDTVLLKLPPGDMGEAGLLLLLAEDEDRLADELRRDDLSGSLLLDLLPTRQLVQLAARPTLALPLRAQFARVAWTRDYALQKPIPATLDTAMRDLNPEVTHGWRSHAGRRTVKNHALLLDVLRSPAMNILPTSRTQYEGSDAPALAALDTLEHSDNNWWCAWQPARHAAHAEDAFQSLFYGVGSNDGQAARGALEPMLRASILWRSRDLAEDEALAHIESAPQQFSERAIAWVRHPGLFGNRAGRDEALALAVRTTRYGCQRQSGHGVYSRAAFQLLHQRFPTSDAAKRTKYWFDCSHSYGGCPASAKRKLKIFGSDRRLCPSCRRTCEAHLMRHGARP